MKSAVRDDSSSANASFCIASTSPVSSERWMQCLVSPMATVAAAGELRDERRGGGLELAVGHRAVDEPPGRRLRAGELAAEQQQLLRARDADEARQQPGRAAVRAEAALEERLPEAGRLGGDREVGGERELEAEPGRPAAHRADDRQLELREQLDQPVRLERRAALEAARPRSRPGRVGRHPVRAGAEVGSAAGEDDDAERVVGRGRLERGDDAPDRGGVERILARGRSSVMRSTPSRLSIATPSEACASSCEACPRCSAPIESACESASPKVCSSTQARLSR